MNRRISIHALRVEGDRRLCDLQFLIFQFLSTPSGWRATIVATEADLRKAISIHALRVEGDTLPPFFIPTNQNFYPRPPGGGRLSYAILRV